MLSKDTLFALSLFPYLGFLWFLTRSKQAPRLVLFGFYFLLVFVAVTIPAGIYAKIHYGEMLANVDWLHGSAESLLTISNIIVVLGFSQAIAQYPKKWKTKSDRCFNPQIYANWRSRAADYNGRS